jgi:acyl dehydratase
MTPPPDAIAADIVGVEIGPITHAIDARWLMAYAAALDEDDPRYFDTLAAGGPLAHPLFAVCYEWPAALALRDRAIAAALHRRSVHATHRLAIHRPPRAGDTLRTTGRVIAVEARRAGTRVLSRFVTVDAAGHPVTTTDYGSVYRDVPLSGAGAGLRPARPPASAAPAPAPTWHERIDVAAQAARVYTECARIYNPIHTDVAVARGAGLPAPILHGTATLALAVSRALRHAGAGDPGRVAEVAATFTGMVAMPSSLTVRGAARPPDGIAFEVMDGAGAAVIAGGLIRLGAPA